MRIPLAALSLWLLASALPAAVRWNGHPVPARRGTAITAPHEAMIVEPAKEASPPARRQLEAAGFRVLGYVPDGAYLVDATPAAIETRLAFRTATPIDPAWKVDDILLDRLAAGEEGGPEVRALVYSSHLSGDLRLALANAGAIISNESSDETKGRLGVRIPAKSLAEVLDVAANDPTVYLLMAASGAHLLNDNANHVVQGGSDSGTNVIWSKGIHGEGQVVGVLDTGADYDNCYLRESNNSQPPVVRFATQGTATGTPDLTRRKLIIYDMLLSSDDPAVASNWDSQGHGTYVTGNCTGSKLGSETSGADRNGIAPLAKLVMQDAGYAVDACGDIPALGCPLTDLTPYLDQAYNQGARFHNNSYGDREDSMPQNSYTGPTADMDDAMWRHPDFLIVCAAGNSGPSNDTVGSPSVAKNVLSAAACGSFSSVSLAPSCEIMAGFSSRGYAEDGRIKPDIASPGVTYSAVNDPTNVANCSTGQVYGTSMASPVTMGSAALVRQYYADGFYPTGAAVPANAFAAPSAALIKATMLSGAVNMTSLSTKAPDRTQGWGRTSLDNSLYFTGDSRKLVAIDQATAFNSSADAPRDITVTLGGATAAGDVRFTLVYTDYPALPNANPCLVNNLDLEVSPLPSGSGYLGNQINSTTGYSTAGASTRDNRNNVEQVILPAATTGTFRVRVAPTAIIEAGQRYALVITGDVALSAPAGDRYTIY